MGSIVPTRRHRKLPLCDVAKTHNLAVTGPTHGFDVEQSGSTDPLAKKAGIMALPLAADAPQGCVALRAPVPCTPLPRAGFAVAERWTAE